MTLRTIAVGVCLTLACGALATAKPKKKKKQQQQQQQGKPSKALKSAFKELRKLKSYRVDFSVKGGTARGAGHTVQNPTVSHSWSAQVRGRVDNLNGGVAFRLRRGGQSGAIQDGGNWKALLATSQGRLIGRLFKRPEVALGEALRHSRRGKWLPTPSDGQPSLAPGTAAAPSQGTQSRAESKKKASSEQNKALMHVIRIEAPAQEAVKQFNRIVASGCFSEG
ncbi:MAG: hypothetical protein JKY65_20860 [Planctomycetes bacterium]|nr:hypothetical protein [Planctomycetota bacterium]